MVSARATGGRPGPGRRQPAPLDSANGTIRSTSVAGCARLCGMNPEDSASLRRYVPEKVRHKATVVQ